MIKLNQTQNPTEDGRQSPKTLPTDPIETQRRTLQENAQKLGHSPNEKAAKKVLKLSVELSSQYEARLMNDLEQGFRTCNEQELWKNCFYSSIEALRKQSTNSGPHSSVFRQYFLAFIEQAIEFYESLLKKYEAKFGVNFANYLRWPSEDGFPPEHLEECCISNTDQPIHDTTVLRSAQRHMIFLGDLHRYKAQNQEVERKDFSMARRYYLLASSLEPMNGHPFNQLAVIACYNSTLQRLSVEMMFWYVRALSVRLPFDPARDSIEITLNNFRGPAMAFEKWFWEKMENKENEMRANQQNDGSRGPMINRGKEGVRARSKYIREIWIRPKEENIVDKQDKKIFDTNKRTTMHNLEEMFVEQNGIKLQKQAVTHLLNSAGILISNIGSEQFKRSSKLLLEELTAFLVTDSVLITPLKILQIVVIFAFPAHSVKAGASQTLVTEQRNASITVMLNILEKFLTLVCDDVGNIGLFLLTGKLSKKFSRILPSLCFVINWLFAQLSHQAHDASLDLHDIIFKYDSIWILLTKLCNSLEKLLQNGELTNCSIEQSRHSDSQDRTYVVLPEFVVVSPFFNIVPKCPPAVCIHSNRDQNGDNLQLLAVHARFGLILSLAKRMATDEERICPRLKYGNDGFIYASQDQNEKSTMFDQAQSQEGETSIEKDGQRQSANVGATEDLDEYSDCVPPTSNDCSIADDESELKKKLLLDEQSSFEHQWIIEIRPKYLVPDTNTFIDHLDQAQLLVQSGVFTILVPTIVVDELGSLSLGVPMPGSTILSRELLNPEGSKAAVVMNSAKAAMEWLREVADKRVPNISSVTSNGNVLHRLIFAVEGTNDDPFKRRSNDDLILAVCVNLCERLERAGSTSSSCTTAESTRIERTVVLLTEDRGLSAKAEAEKVPVRTMPNFVHWALPSKEQQAKRRQIGKK